MKLKIVFSVLLIGVFLLGVASAEVPKMINYQGKLTSIEGALIDTTVPMSFAIYSDSIGVDSLWSEIQLSVVVRNGIFSVLLGSVNPIPDSVFDGNMRYLGAKVSDDSEMIPRRAIVSVGYAYRSVFADTASYTQGGIPSGVIVMWSGSLGNIPSGWALCDGTNGTPDLTDKFIKSVPDGFTDPGATGGASAHNHPSGSYTAPSHQHSLPIAFDGALWIVDQTSGNVTTGWNTDGASYSPQSKSRLISDSSGGGPITGSSASASSLPPYYELAFIMKL